MDTQNAEPQTAEPETFNAEAPATGRKKFTDEQVAEIRRLRSLCYPDDHPKAGKPTHSHKALADQFETAAGVISHIVRNRVYKNPDYVPVNDGK